MNNTAPITIVMPVRDRASVVGRTLESIERQTFRPLSVVIVDNGSTDITPEIVEKWRRRVDGDDFKVTVVTEPRPGASAARNRGLREVESEYVMFFDSDDEMLPRHVELAAAYLAPPDARHPRHSALGGPHVASPHYRRMGREPPGVE